MKKTFGTQKTRAIRGEKAQYEMDTVSDDFSDDLSVEDEAFQSQSDSNMIKTRNLDNSHTAASAPWYKSPKAILLAILVFVLVSICVVAPAVLGVILTRNPLVGSNATTTTTVATIARSAYWDLDNDGMDLYGIYNGVTDNTTTFSNSTYFGYGFNLALNATNNQSVIVPSPFFNISYTSFTVEAWIYLRSIAGDNSVFAQCQCSSCQDRCLYLIVRNGKVYMGFTLDDLVGSTSLIANTWYHVAFVYDYVNQTQLVYIQGVLDGSRSSAGPYLGINGSIVIGGSHLSSSSFNGFIDNVKLTTKAKSSSEILAAGSVVVHLSFDGATLGQDMGPNQMNGTISNCAAVSGRVGKALAFSGSLSYVQIPGFYMLGRSNQPFSFALWIYPYSNQGGTLIRKVNTPPSSGWCQDMMGLTFPGQISFYTNGGSAQITGPFVPEMQWTHIVYTFNSTNGQTMYFNGVQYAQTGAMSFSSSGLIDWLVLGYNFGGCTPNPIYGGYFLGAMDEFYVFRRELTATDVHALANP